MRSLLHLPNRPDLLDQKQLDAYLLGKFVGAKLMPEHSPDHIAQLEAVRPGGWYMARCENVAVEGQFRKKTEDLSLAWFNQVKVLEAVGCYVFQLDTEPNNQMPRELAYIWQWWVHEGVIGLRARLTDYWRSQGLSSAAISYKHSRIKLYLGPLADGPGHWAEIEQPVTGWWSAYHYLMSVQGALQGLCVDSYWQYTKHSLLDGYGANCARFHGWAPEWPIIVAEWGCSLIDEYPKDVRDNPPPEVLARVEAMMLESYHPWLRWVENQAPYVVAGALYICPGSYMWRGFEPSDAVLTSLA